MCLPRSTARAGRLRASTSTSIRKLAESALGKTIESSGAAEAGVEVTPILCEGHPVDVLLGEAGKADLLVVGTRGLGELKGLLLGSVSQQVAHQATCPVVIVPPVSVSS